ncbi:MAG TPA: hypothetical protein VHV78_12235 [Gemmatimonadaceae bacterium]|jgi:hypothetical protein|nr:hypothetical protein [Gemmatimonadaceae bacterium]
MRRDKLSGVLLTLAAMVTAGTVWSCGDLSPTNVKNPNLTAGQFLGTTAAGVTWLYGVQKQFLTTLNIMVQDGELLSDDYYNDYTTNDQLFDAPEIDNFDTDVTSMQSNIARLRHVASFGLDSVFPLDTTVTVNMKAELLFFRGMASLFAGESFTALPADALGAPVTWDVHLKSAITDFTAARAMSTDVPSKNSYTLALARAHYRLAAIVPGERALAVTEATALLAANPTFIRQAVFDPVNGPSNSMQGLLTSSVNNLQPLPRLDFLDPKYPNRGTTIQSPIDFLKAEEAHLILAEALLQAGDIAGTKDRLNQLLALVQSRTVELVDGTLQKRGRAGGKIIYPNTSSTVVAPAPGQPFISGLVLTRQGPMIKVPTTSGTSVTSAQINGIVTVDDGLYILSLMRQEIFIAEGRRAADLGIRIPLSLQEIQSNPNAQGGAAYSTALIPSYIPTNFGLDGFTYDSVAKTVVIKFDMNRVIVQNKALASVLPLLK